MEHGRKLAIAVGVLFLTLVIGVIGYRVLGGPQWTLLDCVYMTVITLTTVGYGETHDMTGNPALRIWTMFLLLSGFGTMAYAFTTLTAFVVEGELNQVIKKRRMSKGISDLRGHFIVCGMGETGHHVVEELRRTRRDYVCVDSNLTRMERLLQHEDFFHIAEDATDDEVLLKAGILRAAGLVACLPTDKDNLFVTLSARNLNPHLRIVAKVIDVKAIPKLQKAGADSVVSPQAIGGLRLVSEMVRPQVVGFLDKMMRSQTEVNRIEEVVVAHGSHLAGTTVEQSGIRSGTGLLILAIKDPNSAGYNYNPVAQTHLKVGATLVVLGEVTQIQALRRLAGPECVEDAEVPQESEKPS